MVESRVELRSVAHKIKHELSPYILPQEFICEESNEKIGTGSYGTITKIKYCGTPCAVKELHSILISDSSDLDNEQSPVSRFCNEMKILSKIQHPNFVRFVGIYYKADSSSPVCPLLVMELMHTTLSKCLELKSQLPIGTKTFILRDVARAVAYIHCQNPPIVHRDLTANNVLLTSNLVAKVGDLGMAKFMNNSLKLSSTKCPGTVVYMPPEALEEHPHYGTEIDMYSYGVLGFHTLSAKWPLLQGARTKDGSVLTDLERCHADMIGDGSYLKEVLKKCLCLKPTQRPTANEILVQVEAVILKYGFEERNLMGAMNCINELQAEKMELSTAKQRLLCSNEDLKEAVKSFKDDKSTLEHEVSTLRSVVDHQQNEIHSLSSGIHAEKHATIQHQLIEAEHEAKLHCLTLQKEKNHLSDTVEKLEARVSALLTEVKSKEKQFLTMKNELEEKNLEYLETITKSKKQVTKSEDRTKLVQDRYIKLLQDLLIPHKGILCSKSAYTILSMKPNINIDLQPIDEAATTLHSIKTFPSVSFLHKSVTVLFQDDKLFFLCELYFKNQKQPQGGIMIYCDIHKGNFNIIKGSDVGKILCISHFGDSIIGLEENKRLVLLENSVWSLSPIPPLLVGELQNPIILTYQSSLFVIDGKMMFVHDDVVCDWVTFQLLTVNGTLEASPKNTYVVLAGKLFVCSPAQKTVYYLELKQIYDIILKYNGAEAAKSEASSDQKNIQSNKSDGKQKDVRDGLVDEWFSQSFQYDITLARILKGANFIFPHNGKLLALNATQLLPRVSTMYIDRAWCYDVRCCHWHIVECTSDLTHGCWLSMPGGTGVVEFSSSWRGWGHAKMNEVSTHEAAV